MVANDLGRRLHDRFTRGESLTAEQQAQLEEWYAEQDREEMRELKLATEPGSLPELRAQIDKALAQIAAITARIQELTAQNAVLRQEIAALRNAVAHILQPA